MSQGGSGSRAKKKRGRKKKKIEFKKKKLRNDCQGGGRGVKEKGGGRVVGAASKLRHMVDQGLAL